ncbi:MAG: SDR family NAD(P)-dependent oxidoreductase [Alphaproteobacteria bacterium]|nr:SDR family NAD(P)-dependent oxidoreductase [Alphaproteobacteria bacterium]
MNPSQKPLGSGFGARSTVSDVLQGIDLGGRYALVTGGASGLGLAAVRALVASGAEVLVPARNMAAAANTFAGEAGVTVAPFDLADQQSITAFAETVLKAGRPLDMLIASAGIMACPETRIGPGWESQFGTNHLGHFALVNHLAPLLVAGRARVVMVSSGAHGITGMRWDDVQFDKGYDKWAAYGQSKTANALFAVELDRRGAGVGVRAFSLHPGAILTPLQRHLPKEEMVAAGWIDAAGNAATYFKSVAQGAATMVWAATSPLLEGIGGVYCEDCDVAPLATEGKGVRPHAVDPDEARRLWALSVELTGVDGFAAS